MMLGQSFEQCISIAFMAEEEQDYSLALSYLIKASKLASSDAETAQCQQAIDICLTELESCSPHDEDLLVLRQRHLSSESACYLS